MLSEERKKRNQETLGATLKAARERMGYTQKALASEFGQLPRSALTLS